MNRILIVEDSTEAFELARRALGGLHQIEWAKNVAEATRAIEKKVFDLALLDINLPDGDGFRLCSVLQAHQDFKGMAVIFLTAHNSVPDKIMGFSVGADDFISKPFDPLELKARVEAKLRRRESDRSQAQIVRAGDLEINKDLQRVCVLTDGQAQEIDLTPIEFKILLLLAGQPNTVFSRNDVLDAVWGENVHVYSRSVDTHVSKLRKKLGEQSQHIESVHGSGYRFGMVEGPSTPSDLFNQGLPATAFAR